MTKTNGFSLPEILLALLVMSGALVSLMGGLRGAEALERRAAFEERAAAYAEREIELLKNDLQAGLRPGGPAHSRGRFRLPGGWKTSLAWTPQPGEPSIRLACTVESGDNRLAVESFLFLPESGRAVR
ncbi:MAG TPA: prepilin-type N-terminal cleavage/methylation domain-containing protein [Candidatus Ozemobacteraceae bacterium]|nr:prepilin-type N-terminal cleavage/methylation domain-containing protein [Candidatus Ozemobacteraceae bacterium]HQG28555.1 prepilin-type N-terminal cleavage/methylation domain-containing protein [Candidatus Ozemobacteraceae bacterium]